jgi:hypothetical protein
MQMLVSIIQLDWDTITFIYLHNFYGGFHNSTMAERNGDDREQVTCKI